ncbi:MAG: DUF2764 family protein [Porphyromonas sp.]|nr:DUF2764 family protein [Porphyromonas sp.]
MGEYYTLGAQLPSLKKGDYRSHSVTSSDFIETLYRQVSKRDRLQLELLLLRNDNVLLLKLLRGDTDAETVNETDYVLGFEKLQFLVNATEKKIEAERNAVTEYQELDYPKLPKGVYPQYMIDFVELYIQDRVEDQQQPYFYADILLMGYAKHVQKKGNDFLRRWFDLEYKIAATFAALTADKFDLPRENYILGDTAFDRLLIAGDWREMAYTPEGELTEVIRKIADEENLAIREQRIDDYKWAKLDEVIFTDIFSINAMLVYLLKLQILERWEKLDKVQGERQFRAIVNDLNKDFKGRMQEFKASLKQHARSKRIDMTESHEK